MFFILGIINGALTALSRAINAALGARVGELKGSFVSHAVGSLTAGFLVLGVALGGVGTGQLSLGDVPVLYLSGGCAGVLVVAAGNYAAARIGVTLLAMLMLTFQLATSAFIDHFGWLEAQVVPITPQRGLGLLLLAAGALIVLTERSDSSSLEEASTDAPTGSASPGRASSGL